MKNYLKHLFILTALALVLPFTTDAQKGGRAKKAPATTVASEFCNFSFGIIGDNIVDYPYQCNDAVVFQVTCGLPNQWYAIKFPTNGKQSTTYGQEIMTSEVQFLTDATGTGTFVFNFNGCIDAAGYDYLSPQNANKWNGLPDGTYLFEVRWFYSLTYLASAPVIVNNTVR